MSKYIFIRKSFEAKLISRGIFAIHHKFLGLIILLESFACFELPEPIFFWPNFFPFIKYYSMYPVEESWSLYFLLKFIKACPL